MDKNIGKNCHIFLEGKGIYSLTDYASELLRKSHLNLTDWEELKERFLFTFLSIVIF